MDNTTTGRAAAPPGEAARTEQAHPPPRVATGVCAGGIDGGMDGGGSGDTVASGPATVASGRAASGPAGPAPASGATPASGPGAGPRARRALVARIAAVVSGEEA